MWLKFLYWTEIPLRRRRGFVVYNVKLGGVFAVDVCITQRPIEVTHLIIHFHLKSAAGVNKRAAARAGEPLHKSYKYDKRRFGGDKREIQHRGRRSVP